MPGIALGGDQPQYSCKCLNIRVRSGQTDSVAEGLVNDPNFVRVFVGDEGIAVIHPQVTVRTRNPGILTTGTSPFSRYTTVTCLLCGLLVYRVHQVYSVDVEGKDGPVLPAEDWVEHDVLKSLNGWIEVHKDCLVGNAIEQATSSANYSRLLNLLLPLQESPSLSPRPIFERPPSPSYESPPSPPNFFTNMPPVFLPPPFSPSHPVFTYLASFAANESQRARDTAEGYMAKQMKLKASEIENTDSELRNIVNALWIAFKENLSHIQEQNGHRFTRRQSGSGSRERAVNGLEPLSPGASKIIRDFTPTEVARARSSSPPIYRTSALSASLTTSSFQDPRGRSTVSNSLDHPRSTKSNGSPSHSASSLGSTTIVAPHSTDATNILKVRRNMSEGVDTATSFRYFATFEEDMARLRERRRTDQNPTAVQVDDRPRDPHKDASIDITETSAAPQENSEIPVTNAEGQLGKSSQTVSGKSKRKQRKVTFDVKPAVVTIKREVASEQEDTLTDRSDGDLIFELEDLEEHSDQDHGEVKPVLQLLEQPALAARSRRRQHNADNLSVSFSSLRPISLPAPSYIRPPRSQHGSDLSSSVILSFPKSSFPITRGSTASTFTASSSQRPMEDRDLYTTASADIDIVKLAAVDTPSHRGTSKPDSKAWQSFVLRHPAATREAFSIPEEPEGSEFDFVIPDADRAQTIHDMFVGSMPIPIKVGKQKEQLSLASYQPQTLTPQVNPNLPTANKQPSSAAVRKAVYAQRDRLRTLDPGPLDFATEDDEDDEDNIGGEDDTLDSPLSTGERGRKVALRILKARSEIPEEGMWRSLA